MFRALDYRDWSHLPSVQEPEGDNWRAESRSINNRGIKQGCGLSSVLFNIYIKEAIKVFQAVSVHEVEANCVLYTIMFC